MKKIERPIVEEVSRKIDIWVEATKNRKIHQTKIADEKKINMAGED